MNSPSGPIGSRDLDRLVSRICADLAVDPAYGSALLLEDEWKRSADADLAFQIGVGLSRAACRAGDHEAEAVIGRALVESASGDAAALRTAWLVRLGGLEHLADSDDTAGIARLRSAGLEAYDDVDRALREAAVGDAARRSTLDPIAAVVGRAERELEIPLGDAAADLDRRRDARRRAWAPTATFWDKHGDAVRAIAVRDGRTWWLERFVERFGMEPPDDWWVADPASIAGGRVSVEYAQEGWFDPADEVAFVDEMEARFRTEAGLPARGEGRIGQPHLRRCLEAVLPSVPLECEASPGWLGRQRLDFFLPTLGLAIEYQGEQHFIPLEHWGGEAGLQARRELDERKRDACAQAGVRLLEWRYDEPISAGAVRRRLERAGILEIG